jgi:hypothetical protein
MAWIGTEWEERIQPAVDDTFLGKSALCNICESHSIEERMKFKHKGKIMLTENTTMW